MKSPVASNKQMTRVDLDEGLSAFQCVESEGVYLPIASYFRWLGKQPERLPHLPAVAADDYAEIAENEEHKICPETGQLMMRYKVGKGFNFHLDRSPSGSIWFDKGEWEALKERQFHDELHLIFTAPWQVKVRDSQKDDLQNSLLQERFGVEVFKQLDDLKKHLKDHPYQAMAIAYLGSK